MTIKRKSKEKKNDSDDQGQQNITPPANENSGESSHNLQSFTAALEEQSPIAPDDDDRARAEQQAQQEERAKPAQPAENAPPPRSNAPAPGSYTDSEGTPFDPAKHAVKADGTPSYAASGKFRARRGTGSRVGTPRSKAAVPETTPDGRPVLTEAEKMKAARTAAGLREIFFRSCMTIGGPEWTPIKNDAQQIDERREMHSAMTEVCEYYGVTELHPLIGVGFVMITYASPRFTLPETQRRTKKAASAISRGWKWLRNKFKRNKNAARTDNGNDGKREVNASKTDSSPAETTGTRSVGTGPDSG